MSNILDRIIAHKQTEVAKRKAEIAQSDLAKQPLFQRATLSLREHLLKPTSTGIIAEFKRKSPSKGPINPEADLLKVTSGYEQSGATGLSILTDEFFFGGQAVYIEQVRPSIAIPILRKEFIIDPYQVYEAKAIGADVILLIAECLSGEQVMELAKTAKALELDVLMEVHSEDQLMKLNSYIDIVGVNNRNLKNFSVDIETSVRLFDQIPNEFVKISESGISKPESIVYLKKVGFQGFLIGEYFMLSEDPAQRLSDFLRQVNQLEQSE